MFDAQALTQLSKLKNDIISSKEYAVGKVVGTQSRYGFVRLDDGRDVFLSPEKMQHVLPGDSVNILVLPKDNNKWEAELESLVDSPLKKFIGIYHSRNNGHFIEPVYAMAEDLPESKKVAPVAETIKRWIFVPPKQRASCDEGDYVVAQMQRHPFKDGRAQAKVVRVIGQGSQEKFELKLTQAKYMIEREVPAKVMAQSEALLAEISNTAVDERKDLSHLPFVTIDSVTTRDMDDAIALVTEDGQHVVYVAIADPSRFIAPDSAIASECEARAQTAYLCGGTVSMLPTELANEGFSLLPACQKPALTCRLQFDGDGAISSYSFMASVIQSRHKLSYESVAGLLGDVQVSQEEQAELPAEIQTMLKQLYELAAWRTNYRNTQGMNLTPQQEYHYELDNQGHISAIEPRPRLLSHQLVEECMVAVNSAAGDLLAKHQRGLFSVHEGFRKDRLGEVSALLKEEGIVADQLETLSGYIALFKQLQDNEEQHKLIPALHRFSTYSHLSLQAAPHFGMGIEYYAPLSSPIRRFADLYNHWCVYSILNEAKAPDFNEEQLAKLNERIRFLRQADRELMQWLSCLYLSTQVGKEVEASIRIVTQQGMGARITSNGIDGFVLLPKKQEKTFDAKRMTLTTQGRTYHLQDDITVRVKGVDIDKRRISFELVR